MSKMNGNKKKKNKPGKTMNLNYDNNINSNIESEKTEKKNAEENMLKLINKKLNHPLIYEDIQGTPDGRNQFIESDEETECIEYIFRPRRYFLHSLCQHCSNSHMDHLVPCEICQLVFYCSEEHRTKDRPLHAELCNAFHTIALETGDHIFKMANGLSETDYQIFRINTIFKCENILQRQLQPFEKEILLFPRLCSSIRCRESHFELLRDCQQCGQISFCVNHSNHLTTENHQVWCKQLKLFQQIISYQGKFGKICPKLPTKVLPILLRSSTISHIFTSLYNKLSDIGNVRFYTELTQIASPALTTWLSLRLSDLVGKSKLLIHIIGAEQQFEIDNLQKWETFFLHLLPALQKLTLVFIGPELNMPEINLIIQGKQKLCEYCLKVGRNINYNFENLLYHEYSQKSEFRNPDLVCYFNPGLYRETGFNATDTWPDTIKKSVNAHCPVLVTSYTQYESILDLKSYLKSSDRPVDIILPAIVNPFRSQRPERNFISADEAPLIYKNYYLFVVN